MRAKGHPTWKSSAYPAAILYILLYLAWLFWGREVYPDRFLIGTISLIFSSLVSFSLSFWVARALAPSALRKAWVALCLGLALWTLADSARLLSLNAWLSEPLAFRVRDSLLLLGFLPIWLGFLVFPRAQPMVRNKSQLWINVSVTTAAAVTLIWILVITPLQQTPVPAANPLASWVPIADLLTLILLLVLFLLSDTRQLSLPLMLFSLGILSYLFSDLLVAQLSLQTGYQTGGLADAGWMLGDFFFFLAAGEQLASLQRAPRVIRGRLLTRLQSLLPFLAIIGLGWYVLIDWWIAGTFNPLALWMTFLLSLAMIVRQAMLAGEVSIRQYASLVNSIAQATFICDAKGILQLVNPAFTRLTGIPQPNAVQALPMDQLFTPAQDWPAVLRQAEQTGWDGEINLLRGSLPALPVSLSLRPIHPKEDRRLVIAATLFDLSQQNSSKARSAAPINKLTRTASSWRCLTVSWNSAWQNAPRIYAMPTASWKNKTLLYRNWIS